jgi:hypothetical protein
MELEENNPAKLGESEGTGEKEGKRRMNGGGGGQEMTWDGEMLR